MNVGDLIRIATVGETGLAEDLTTEVKSNIVAALNSLNITVEDMIDFRITSENELEYYDGVQWNKIEVDIKAIRDTGDEPLKFQVTGVEPEAVDGRVYYNNVQNIFYVSRGGQWHRLFVSGDEKIDREPPTAKPELLSKTDTTVTLVDEPAMEFRYQGGGWQQDAYFSNLARNEEYLFEKRYETDDVYKASEPSPFLSVTTDKGEQEKPTAPELSELDHDRATVTSVSGAEVKLEGGAWFDSPHTFTGLTEETPYKAFARMKETSTHYASPESAAKTFTTPKSQDDPTDSPGPVDLVGGDMNAGYFGVVPTSELFTGTEIASACGITQGTSQFPNEGWLKFAIDGKIIFKSKKTYRHSISWDHIDSKGCVDGTKTVTKNGHTYKVRLMKGALTDPSKYSDSDRGAVGSEWNRLMLPIHVNAPSNWAYSQYTDSPTADWGVNFTDADLQTHNNHGDGSYHWCQEVSGGNAAFRVNRGGNGVSSSSQGTSSNADADAGWSPVLEFIS